MTLRHHILEALGLAGMILTAWVWVLLIAVLR